MAPTTAMMALSNPVMELVIGDTCVRMSPHGRQQRDDGAVEKDAHAMHADDESHAKTG
jgi:hypothetical protein